MIEVKRRKEFKSTTKVTGLLVQLTNDNWYLITKMLPPRNGWFIKCSKCNSAGRNKTDELFSIKYLNEPLIEDGILYLISLLNNEIDDPIKDKIVNDY